MKTLVINVNVESIRVFTLSTLTRVLKHVPIPIASFSIPELEANSFFVAFTALEAAHAGATSRAGVVTLIATDATVELPGIHGGSGCHRYVVGGRGGSAVAVVSLLLNNPFKRLELPRVPLGELC